MTTSVKTIFDILKEAYKGDEAVRYANKMSVLRKYFESHNVEVEEFDPAQVVYGFGARKLAGSAAWVYEVGLYYLPKSEQAQKLVEKWVVGMQYQQTTTEVRCLSDGGKGKGYIPLDFLVYFNLAPYPACCGLKLFHNFSTSYYEARVNQEDFNTLMLDIFKWSHSKVQSLFSSRVEAVFVSSRNASKPKTRTTEPTLPKDQAFLYGKIRKFFYGTAAKIQAHTFYNYNSGHTLEKCEALFDSQHFPY